MSEFLAALQTFPTFIYTCLLGLVLLYWLTVIIGALDLHVFSPDGHDVDGDTGIGGHGGHSLGEFLSIGKVPVTITLSLFVFLLWLLAMLAELTLRGSLGNILPNWMFSAVLVPATVIPSFMVTAFAVRPLRAMFSVVTEAGGMSLIGRMVRVTSRSVDTTFGTAECNDNGAGILLNVMCRDGVQLKRDDMAVVVEYDESRQSYVVAPFSHTPADGAVPVSRIDPGKPVTPPSTPVPPVSLERQHERPH